MVLYKSFIIIIIIIIIITFAMCVLWMLQPDPSTVSEIENLTLDEEVCFHFYLSLYLSPSKKDK